MSNVGDKIITTNTFIIDAFLRINWSKYKLNFLQNGKTFPFKSSQLDLSKIL
jgi:hypothetical protein